MQTWALLHSKNKLGFSLIEVLVAIMILSFIMSTVWVVMTKSLGIQENTKHMDERNHEIRAALERIAREISMAFLSRNRSLDTRTQTLFLGTNSGDSDRLDFTSLSHFKILRDAKESDECELSYFTEPGENKNLVLIRREDSQIDEDPETGGNLYPILENILSFNLQFFDSRKNAWVEDWNTESVFYQDRLPSRVEIRITYLNYRGNPEIARTITPLHMMDVLGQ